MEQLCRLTYHFIDVMATHALAIHIVHSGQQKIWIYVKQVEEVRSEYPVSCVTKISLYCCVSRTIKMSYFSKQNYCCNESKQLRHHKLITRLLLSIGFSKHLFFIPNTHALGI